MLGATTKDNLGLHLGTVMIGEASPTVWQRLSGASSYLLAYLGIASGLGLVGSWLLARRVKRQTLGLEPREIAGLAEHREAMLYGIAEGVIALDPHHRLTLVNEMGRRLLDLPEDCVGKSLTDLGIEGRLRDVLAGAQEEAPHQRDEVVLRRGRVLVMNRMTVTKDGRRLGSVTTLRDRTELAQLERELGSFRSSTELLRAQAHEFANQLHTISGLIQIGEYDEVVRYVGALTRHRESLDLTLTSRVRDTAVAALLMAKSAQAAERRVTAAHLGAHRAGPARPPRTPPTWRPWSATSSTTPWTPPRPGRPVTTPGSRSNCARTRPAWRSWCATRARAWRPSSRRRSSRTASPPRPPGRANAASAWR